MADELLSQLVERLKLTKEEKGEIFDMGEGEIFDMGEDEIEDYDKQAQFSLVCKLLTLKNIPGEVFKNMMPRIWANVNVKIESVGKNLFLCKFKTVRDKSKILNNGPWFFDKSMVMLEEPRANCNFNELEFRKKEETTQHILWECKVIKDIWINCTPIEANFFYIDRTNWTTKEYWEWLMDKAGEEERRRSMIIACQIWEMRNKSIFKGVHSETRDIQLAIDRYIINSAGQDTNLKRKSKDFHPIRRIGDNTRARWKPPTSNSWKLNTDAAWRADTNTDGIGWILRDEKGEVIKTGCRIIRAERNITYLEVMAICEGLRAIRQEHCRPIHLESDSLEAIHLLHRHVKIKLKLFGF
ncbi:uncharacterized protein LOC111022134 isoform X1 [Momordica charantia]|uniref:Uncharacterized protein LOC111022134 isoform X1 n=1 Tax=Momordica charantia TaxID=3673 RepID=A0A6J1DL64_MOMCH|nr:uncharacterized protein LOC111022134 isoform X1 [Momordica charantia]